MLEQSTPMQNPPYQTGVIPGRIQAALSIVDGVVVVTEDGALAEMNTAAEALFGISLEKAAGRPLTDLMPGIADYFPFPSLVEHSDAFGGLTVDARDVSGTSTPVHVTVSESLTTARKKYILVLRDFRRIDVAVRRALRAERWVADGGAIATVTHEYRNALQCMQSFLALVRIRGNEQVQALVDDIQGTQDQLRQLFEEIRSVVTPITLERKRADVRRIVERAWRQLRLHWSKKGVGLTLELDEASDTRAFVDPLRLGHALREVLEKAIEASPAEGTVVCSFVDHGKGGSLELAVEDSGPGLSAEDENRPFDLPPHSGRSAGAMELASVRRLIREHDGDVLIEDRPEGGLRVVITLPHDDLAI
jgi:PAS domain S-box-containing protein